MQRIRGVHTSVHEMIELVTYFVPTGIAALDRDFRLVAMNQRFIEITAVSQQSNLQTSVFEIFRSVHSALTHEIQALRSARTPIRGIQIRSGDENVRWRADLYPCPVFMRSLAAVLLILWDDVGTAYDLGALRSCAMKCAVNASFRLSGREHQVLELIGKGKTTKEIASLLKVSETTVAEHRKHLCDKLDLHSTCELAACGASRASGICPELTIRRF